MEVVRHTRDLLSYVAENLEACNSSRDAKREQKVLSLSLQLVVPVHLFLIYIFLFVIKKCCDGGLARWMDCNTAFH